MAYNFPISNTSGTSSGSYDSFASTAYGNETGLEVSDHDLNEWFEDYIPGFSSFSTGYSPQANYSTPNVQVFADSRRISNISLRDEAMINSKHFTIYKMMYISFF